MYTVCFKSVSKVYVQDELRPVKNKKYNELFHRTLNNEERKGSKGRPLTLGGESDVLTDNRVSFSPQGK